MPRGFTGEDELRGKRGAEGSRQGERNWREGALQARMSSGGKEGQGHGGRERGAGSGAKGLHRRG